MSTHRQIDYWKPYNGCHVATTPTLWNWTRKPRSPANTGDLERHYSPGCQWAGLAYHSCYLNRHRKSYSLPCILDHKLVLYVEHIVSILSIQSYVLCSYLHSCLMSGTQPTLLSVDDGFISLPWCYWLPSPSMWVWTRGRLALNQNAITQSNCLVLPLNDSELHLVLGIRDCHLRQLRHSGRHGVQLIFFRKRTWVGSASSRAFRWHGLLVLL